MLHDIVHDVGGGVVNATRLPHLGLLFHLGPVSRGEANDLAQELLVHLAKDICRQHGELVRAVGIVKLTNDVLEHLIVYDKGWG